MCEQIRYVLWGLITYHELEKKRGKQREKTVNEKNQQLAQPQTLIQGVQEIASLLN